MAKKDYISRKSTEVGRTLKAIRIKRNMSLREVEKLTGVSNSYISQIERGIRGLPTIKILERLLEAYGFSLDRILPHFKSPISEALSQMAPEVSYIEREYNKLSLKSRQQLTSYLEFLVQQEKAIKK